MPTIRKDARHEGASDRSWEEVHHDIVRLMRVDDRTSVVCIAREYLLLGLVLAGGSGAYRAWSAGDLAGWAFLPLAALGAAAVAVFQHRLSGLAHEASHYILFRNRLANDLVSDLLLLFPLLAWTQKYRESHLGHHRFVNDPERDPDWIRLEKFEPMRFPMPRARFWARYVLRGLWSPAILRYLLGRALAANLGSGGGSGKAPRSVYRFRVARCLRGAYWLSVLALVHNGGLWPEFFLFWIAPLVTVYPFLMLLREIAHHANAPDDGDLTNSRVFEVNPLLRAAVFPYGQAFHLTHHLFAMVPHHRLPEAHKVLRQYRPYRKGVVVCRGYFFRRWGTQGPSLLEMLSRPPAPTSAGRPARASSATAAHPSSPGG